MSLLVLLRSILGVASSVLDPIAGALATVISALSVSPSVHGTHWDPGVAGIDALPTGIVGLPRVARTGLDEADSQLGSKDWTLTYPVALIFDLSEAQYSQAQAAEVVEAFIKAIDADLTLGAAVQEAKVTSSEPQEVEDHPRPKLIYRCEVQILKLV